MVSWRCCLLVIGGAPTCPAAAWMFCDAMAPTTSWAVIPSAVIFTGSIHTRIEYFRSDRSVALLTPGMRASGYARLMSV